MEMILENNTSGMLIDDNGEMTPTTPFHNYLLTSFEDILEEIAKGNIPTNTGVPFSVEKYEMFEQRPFFT